MKAMGLKSNGLATTQKVQGRAKFPAVRRGKRLSLRWVRTLLMGRRGRLVALAFTFLMLHLDILPAVASVHLMPASTRVKTASLPPVPLKSRLASWLTAVLPWQRVQEIPPAGVGTGLAACVGCERERLWRRGQLGQRQFVLASADCRLGKWGEFHAGVQLTSQSEPALADCY
jgi:hypothetical protein